MIDGPDPPTHDGIAALLTRVTQADPASAEQLASVLYTELRGLARAYMQRERKEHTLQPTALANEAYIKLLNADGIDWQGRAHFMAIAARTMRTILVDHARRKGARKRGGDRARVPLSDTVHELGAPDLDVLDLEKALEELSALDPRKVNVVEMRFFSGMSAKEIGEVLGVSAATVQDDWYAARAWLRVRLKDG